MTPLVTRRSDRQRAIAIVAEMGASEARVLAEGNEQATPPALGLTALGLTRVRVDFIVSLDDDAVAAYCEHHGITAQDAVALQRHIARTLRSAGETLFDEQIHEGRQALAAHAAKEPNQ